MIAGFYGKLPARGDFVRSALPRSFTDPWDAWLALAIAGSRAAMGDDWLPAFLEAPVWRFALPAGLCGDRAALGLMLPSVDRAGRYFPLTFAALYIDSSAPADDPAWLDSCEAAGRAALEQDAGPDELGAMVGAPEAIIGMAGRTETGIMQSVWWTEGAPRVPATRFVLPGLPDAAVYATMLGAAAPASLVPDVPTGAVPEAPTGAVPEARAGRETWESPS